MKQHHAIQVLLVTALLVWNLIMLAVLNITGQDWPSIQAIAGMGLALGQVCLAAAYVPLGRLNIALRILVLLLVTAQSGYLATLSTGGPGGTRTWFSMLLVVCALVLVPLAVVRMAGGRIVHLSDPPAPPIARWQFSLWETLSFTTGTAFLAAALRWADLPGEAYGAILAFSLATAVPLWACVFSILPVRSLPVGIIAPTIIIPFLGFVLPYTGLPPEDDLWELWGMNLVQGGLVLAVFAVVHLAGYRLELWPGSAAQGPSVEPGIKFLPPAQPGAGGEEVSPSQGLVQVPHRER